MIEDIQTVAFDLDMTLVDSRPVSRRALERLAERGYPLNIELLMDRYGLPLSQWLPAECDHDLFRSLQAQDLSSVTPMPGAIDAVDTVRSRGERVVVVTAAPTEIALKMLRVIGLSVDKVRAGVWAIGKVEPLLNEQCWAFVGDHADDMSAAHQAGAIAVGVSTGMSPPLGANVELEDLNAFGPWLTEQVAAKRSPG